MDNKTQNILQKFSKQRVDLAGVDDLRKIASEAERIIGLQEDGVKFAEKAEADFKEVKKLISDAEGITRGAIRQAAKHKTDSQQIFNKAEIAAKDLGIDVRQIKEYKRAFDLVAEMFENQNQLNGYNDFLKKLL